MSRITYECKNCGHVWHPRKPEVPAVCPKCHSAFWQEGPQRGSRIEALQKAAERRMTEAQIIGSRKPVSPAKRRRMYSKMGIFLPLDDGTVTIGTVNAGPWYEDQGQELPKAGMLELMGFRKETDTIFVVNEHENNGICLTGDDIYPGDVLHFRKGIQPVEGQIVLAEGFDTDGDWFLTAKHWHQRGLTHEGLPLLELRPSNVACKAIQAFPQNILEVSVAISVIRREMHKRRRKGRSLS